MPARFGGRSRHRDGAAVFRPDAPIYLPESIILRVGSLKVVSKTSAMGTGIIISNRVVKAKLGYLDVRVGT